LLCGSAEGKRITRAARFSPIVFAFGQSRRIGVGGLEHGVIS